LNIERQVHFMLAPAFNPADKTGVNNKWAYNRAPDGYLFLLDSVQISASSESAYKDGIFNIFDGHEYTHWNLWPGVESRETLGRVEININLLDQYISLKNWECKEYTLGTRSVNLENPFKVCVIVWYYLKKASRIELMEYAIKHPKNQDMFKWILRGTTLEPTEAGT